MASQFSVSGDRSSRDTSTASAPQQARQDREASSASTTPAPPQVQPGGDIPDAPVVFSDWASI